jgi:hypothetical protein
MRKSNQVEMTITLGYEDWQGFCGGASFAASTQGRKQAVAANRQVFERKTHV